MFGAKDGPSGMEMMLRSMGLGEVLNAAQTLASNGTVEKIIAFADSVGELNERLARIEKALGLQPLAGLIEGEVVARRDAPPGPGPSHSDAA